MKKRLLSIGVVLSFLAVAGASIWWVSGRNSDSGKQLYQAIKNHQKARSLELIRLGADVNIEIEEPYYTTTTCLHEALDPDIVRALLDAGAKVNVENQRKGGTALYLALRACADNADRPNSPGFRAFKEKVRLLIEAGTDINLHSYPAGTLPMEEALGTGDKEIISWMKAAGAKALSTEPTNTASSRSSEKPSSSSKSAKQSIQELLTDLRAEKTPKGTDINAFKVWLGKHLKKGVSTQNEIELMFGSHYRDLDRPARDNIITWEYFLGPPGNAGYWDYLVLDFDSKSKVLSGWDMSQAICGYCPHIFVHTGVWHLEGKLLAGCVGKGREGWDTLVLPRLRVNEGQVRLSIANLAPEVEHINQAKLGYVALANDEQLDVGHDGVPYIWVRAQLLKMDLTPGKSGRAEGTSPLPPSEGSLVVVIEARNTGAFESAMRTFLLDHVGQAPDASIIASFDKGTTVSIKSVGTKFLRRIVIPVPEDSRHLRISVVPEFWHLRRIWFGHGRVAEPNCVWQSLNIEKSSADDALELLADHDEKRLKLDPMEDVVLVGIPPELPTGTDRFGFLLRLSGYYEFLPDAKLGDLPFNNELPK